MSLKPAKVQFNGGELSPWLEARYDISKFDKTARLCRNFIPMAEGCLKRRGGTMFVHLTPEDDEVAFRVKAIPAEAKIMINGMENDYIYVSRGEWVSYEVKAEGYVTKSGYKYIVNDTNITVSLVSMTEMCCLKINPTPSDAVVKIEGYQRTSASFNKNSEVFYSVVKDGYVMKSGTVLLDRDIELNVVLEAEKEVGNDNNFGDWGKAVAFVACSVAGVFYDYKKCILLKFENGYLPILFSAKEKAPSSSDIDESLFFYENVEGVDTIAIFNGKYYLAYIKKKNYNFYYYDLSGKILAAIDSGSLKWCKWPIDENGEYATYYMSYDGVVSANIIKVYYKGELILTLKGRK